VRLLVSKNLVKKKKLFKKLQLTKADCDKQKYPEYKNIFKIVSKKAKIVYYDEQLNCWTHSIKKLWCNMNKLCNTAKQQNNQKDTKLVIDGKEVITGIDVANGLNNYFCNVGDNLVKLLPQAKLLYNDYMKGGVRDSMLC